MLIGEMLKIAFAIAAFLINILCFNKCLYENIQKYFDIENKHLYITGNRT